MPALDPGHIIAAFNINTRMGNCRNRGVHRFPQYISLDFRILNFNIGGAAFETKLRVSLKHGSLGSLNNLTKAFVYLNIPPTLLSSVLSLIYLIFVFSLLHLEFLLKLCLFSLSPFFLSFYKSLNFVKIIVKLKRNQKKKQTSIIFCLMK